MWQYGPWFVSMDPTHRPVLSVWTLALTPMSVFNCREIQVTSDVSVWPLISTYVCQYGPSHPPWLSCQSVLNCRKTQAVLCYVSMDPHTHLCLSVWTLLPTLFLMYICIKLQRDSGGPLMCQYGPSHPPVCLYGPSYLPCSHDVC